MWICMPTMMRPQSYKSSTKYTTTCLHSAEVETPPTSRQNYSYPGFLRRNLRELQTRGPSHQPRMRDVPKKGRGLGPASERSIFLVYCTDRPAARRSGRSAAWFFG